LFSWTAPSWLLFRGPSSWRSRHQLSACGSCAVPTLLCCPHAISWPAGTTWDSHRRMAGWMRTSPRLLMAHPRVGLASRASCPHMHRVSFRCPHLRHHTHAHRRLGNRYSNSPNGTPLIQESLGIRYVVSVYYIMTTLASVGYGDVTPKSTGGVCVLCCMCVWGGGGGNGEVYLFRRCTLALFWKLQAVCAYAQHIVGLSRPLCWSLPLFRSLPHHPPFTVVGAIELHGP
jgi:hypothetical protein